MGQLIYPWDEDFYRILHSAPPPNWRSQVSGDIAYIAPDENGILSILDCNKVDDYLEEHPDETDDENQLECDDLTSWYYSSII
jgi:hypothetical protein